MEGFLKLYRSEFDGGLWAEKRRLSRFEAWLDIQRRVFYADSVYNKRGEVVLHVRETASKWGWGKSATHAFICMLVHNGMLAKTPKTGIYLVPDKKTDNETDNETDTKTPIKPKKGRKSADKKADKTADKETESLPIIKEEKNKRRARARDALKAPTPASGGEQPPSDPWGARYQSFRAWASEHIPKLAARIDRDTFVDMLIGARGETADMIAALEYIETLPEQDDIMTSYNDAIKNPPQCNDESTSKTS